MGRLSTHVLDTAAGTPGAGMEYALFRLDGAARVLVTQGRTNADGRTDAPLLAGDAFRGGRYELVFQAAAYFRARGVPLAEPPFLDAVTLAFGMAEEGHYHVPLLVSPFSFTTYRGS
ncbi:hydroxyisourate hydrolase [Roseococcus sp. DSY-14]|uniref:hydroxyisourate hydrolase n=1 Tax=Roseococcus sp. DSY-14 TaxID=3369650 RepID=UPI00387AC908